MKQRIFKLLLGLIVGIALRAGAENPSRVMNEMTPDALVRQAIRQNPELNFYAAEIAAAKGSLKTAGTIRSPELNTEGGYKNTRDNSPGGNGEGLTWAVSVSQTFEYPGRIALRKAIAQRDVDVAGLHLEQFRLKLAARVRSLAYGVFIAEEKSAAAREVSDRLDDLSKILAQREPAGVTPVLETRIIEATTLTLRRQEREAALAVTTTLAELNQLRGQPANTPLRVSGPGFEFTSASLPTLLAAARINAFDIRIRQAELAQQGFKVALSKNERYTAVAIGPYYSQENAADKEQRVGIGFSLPLPLWDRNVGNIQTSQARRQQAEASLLATEREVERRVAQATATYQAKRDEIDKWQAEAVAKFRETAELADRNYRLGGVPVSVYVETQKQYLEVIAAVHDMKKDALQAAQELEILTGLKFYKGRRQP
jgi:cobalt-zinc-cadmium efflux system outer membrane protein